jgi:tetratricopeptide (TPR) repeat protein
MEVTVRIEKVSIPTYKTGTPEKHPMFLEKRVYQGSSGVVYPHPVIEQIADEKSAQEYNAVFLENEFLEIMILPELGGRIQRAYDKIRQRDFVYYNQVIKPALVGLAGPWISGGIEFNWPQHHRPSTFQAVDYSVEENADGSKTVWVNEVEVMFRTKGMAGFTLYPDKAYLEIKGRLFNRTMFPQTFLWWANPAVKVNEHYQSVFPPDVYAVFDHGKRDVSDFPIATGTYYKVDYAPGTDISRYHTIPVPTSYMAIRSEYDFMGCYEHDTQAGMLHVADHHVSPGKKQWTWGNGDFGFAWDRNLTDEDGPYIELMTGMFTDNQPDFSWLQPNEGKTFEQYFMPYAQTGVVKNATKEAMLNMEWEGQQLQIKIYATALYKDASVRILHDGKEVKNFPAALSPYAPFATTYDCGATIVVPEQWRVIVADKNGRELVSWQPAAPVTHEIPPPATAAKLPKDIAQVEDLYLNGHHLEQYRHATFNPVDYYEEGLRRSPGDIRCNNAMGLLLLRRGQFAKAEPYFRTAIKTMTSRNPNPYDGEVYYNLGCSLLLQGRSAEAYDIFFKATWNDAWQHSGFLMLARIAASNGKWDDALSLVKKSLVRNYHNHTARHLQTIILREKGLQEDAIVFAKESIQIDPFNYGCLFEWYLISNDSTVLQRMRSLMHGSINNYLELSLDYAYAGAYDTAITLLQSYIDTYDRASPLLYYYMGWFASRSKLPEQALGFYRKAATQSPDYCFPNKIEEVLILQDALTHNPTDAKAAYYLGNLWYDKRQYVEAIACWDQSATLDDTYATVHRNLSLAYYNKLHQKAAAVNAMEKAFALAPDDARILMELDQLYKITGRSSQERLSLLENNMKLVEMRDDLYLERVTLYNNLGEFEQARRLLSQRKFHPWEGGEGKVVGQYILCHTALARKAIDEQQFETALSLLQALESYPENLGEGKLYGAQENDLHYLMGCAYEGMGQSEVAKAQFMAATVGISEPVQAIYYNDPQPDKIVYQALAWQQLGQPEKAAQIFDRFIQFGKAHLHDEIRIDYFAVSLPDMLVFDIDLNQRNRIHCLYLMGLGYLGLQQEQQGQQYLDQVLMLDVNHQGATFNPFTRTILC